MPDDAAGDGSERGCRGSLMPYTCPTGSGKAGASK